MQLSTLLSPDRVLCDVTVTDKDAALELMANLLVRGDGQIGVTETLENLRSRERLGSTGLGHGIAIPHGRRQGGQQISAAFVRLGTAIGYDAVDQKPVDLLFALLVPESSTEEHLVVLAALATLFNDSRRVDELRSAASADALYRALIR